MRPIALCLTAALGLLVAGCGVIGGDDDDDGEESSDASIPEADELALEDVPVAPPPQQRPDPLILTAGSAEGATEGTGAGESIHVVEEGETCGAIADEEGVTLEALQAANPDVDCGALGVGAELVIPAEEEEPAADDDGDDTDEETEDGGGSGTYVVQEGDLGSTIADACGITVDELAALNPDDDIDALQVGQELNVPEGCEP
jgi:LysM repeat protein